METDYERKLKDILLRNGFISLLNHFGIAGVGNGLVSMSRNPIKAAHERRMGLRWREKA